MSLKDLYSFDRLPLRSRSLSFERLRLRPFRSLSLDLERWRELFLERPLFFDFERLRRSRERDLDLFLRERRSLERDLKKIKILKCTT